MPAFLQIFSSEGWAVIISGLIGGALAGVSAYFGVRATLRGQAAIENATRRDELAAMRIALHAEIGMISLQCLTEYKDWSDALKRTILKSPRTAFLPPLTIYNAMTPNIGRLSRGEIVALIAFAGTVSDIGVIARALKEAVPQRPDALVHLFSNACGEAADCLNALPVPDAEKDKRFIEALQQAFKEREEERTRARIAYGFST